MMQYGLLNLNTMNTRPATAGFAGLILVPGFDVDFIADTRILGHDQDINKNRRLRCYKS